MGIFPGARVVRGPDWEWDDQDGGDGTAGTVSDVGHGQGTYRSWVTVHWPKGTENNYRCSHKGKMDLRYTERETTGEFYIDHLPRLDATKVRPYVNSGDKVRLLDIDAAKLKELQLERCGWNDEITNYTGKVGDVIVVDKDGDVKVDFGGSSYFINPVCLVMEEKNTPGNQKEDSDDEAVDLTKLLTALLLKSELEKLGVALGGSGSDSSGGIDLFNAAAKGNTNKVREIIKNHPNSVKFQNKTGQTALAAAAHRGHMDSVLALVNGKAPLELKDEDGDTAVTYAVLGNEPDIVKCLLLSGSKINATNKKGLTPLHLAAAKGHQTCTEVLLKHEPRCDVNVKDSDGDTPLAVAIIKDAKEIIKMLVEHPQIDLRLKNNKGFNALHHAVFSTNSFAVERIIQTAPSIVNIAKSDGFTALHLAALNGLQDIILILIKQANCNKEIKNVNGQTALHLAVDKSHNKCIEVLVNNGANVNAQDKDGDTSLHLVMMKLSLQDIIEATQLGQLLELVTQDLASNKNDDKANLIAIGAFLVKNGADIYIKNNKGKNVLDVTLNPRVESLLKQLFEAKRSERRASPGKGVNCKVQ